MNKHFSHIKSYQIACRLSSSLCDHREVFLAYTPNGNPVVLTVYEVKNCNEIVNEFYWRKQLFSPSFPKIIDEGIIKKEQRDIAWICSVFESGFALSDFINRNGRLTTIQVLTLMRDLLIGMQEIAYISNGKGGINGVTQSNYLVTQNARGQLSGKIVSLSHIGFPSTDLQSATLIALIMFKGHNKSSISQYEECTTLSELWNSVAITCRLHKPRMIADCFK